MYEILAKYYDDLMGDFDYDAYEKFALENLKDVWGGFGYDLASGSGEMAIRLKRNGFKVVGRYAGRHPPGSRRRCPCGI